MLVSGAVALVYEVVWQRQLALLLGSSAPATASVLGAYFAGLGLGALVVGRFARRWQRPLRAYAVLEFGIGAGALLVAPGLDALAGIYPVVFQHLADHGAAFLAVRTLTAFVVLLPATFCLGGTLPLLGPLLDRGRHELGRTAGWLYVVNTLGAAVGAVAAPFLLLPWLGLAGSVQLCAALNATLAFIALALDFRLAPTAPPATEAIAPAAAGQLDPWWPAALLSGAGTFALQVLWNRAFAQIHENSLHAFAAIVATVILALAIGGQLARLALARAFHPRRLTGGAWCLAGLVVAASPWLFLAQSHQLAYAPATGVAALGHLLVLSSAVLLLPMLLLGVALPAIMEAAGREPGASPGRTLGRLLAANTLGSILGALLAGYALPAALGLWRSVTWLGLLLVLAGVWLLVAHRWHRHRRGLGLALAVVALASFGPIAALDLPRVRLESDQGERLLALTESAHGVTAVVERDGSRRLKLNNHYGLGGTASTGDERFQAHLPLLLHPAPRRVAFLGLGTGISAGGATFHSVGQITVVELVPEVVAASRAFFGEANRRVLDDRRTRIVADDARNFLRGSGETFDVIVGDLVVPWRQGEGSLFTLEQFAAARRSLRPDGLFCQWLPLFQLDSAGFEILVRTFLTVFPHAELWRGDFSPTQPALALIGRADDTRSDLALIERRLPQLQPDPANPQLQHPANIWMSYVGPLAPADLSPTDLRLNREDRLWLELLGRPASTADSSTAPFVGRPLQAWLAALSARAAAREPSLREDHLAALSAGEALADFTQSLADDDRAGAATAYARLRERLPPAAFQALFPAADR